MDWETIQKNVRSILCCHLETEFERCNMDPNLKKLYQLAQVTIECLLQLQFKMSHELELCQEKLQTKKSVSQIPLLMSSTSASFYSRFSAVWLRAKKSVKSNSRSLRRKTRNLQLSRNTTGYEYVLDISAYLHAIYLPSINSAQTVQKHFWTVITFWVTGKEGILKCCCEHQFRTNHLVRLCMLTKLSACRSVLTLL